MIRAEDLISSATNFILNVTEESIINATAKFPKFPRCPRYTGKHQDAHGFNRAPPYRHLSVAGQSIVTVSYAIGIIGNLTALFILHKEKKTKYKNKKHLLMLGCLLGNDLVALVGMLVQMYIQLYAPYEVSDSHTMCVFRVIWRWFGLASGCVAIVMAIERYFAIARPFFYQRHITYQCVLKAIIISWITSLAIVCMPFIGFGLYFDEKTQCCKRHRFATEPDDVAYAYVWFVFGFLLCICISCANLSVTRSLCRPSAPQIGTVGRRICRPSLKQHHSKMRVEHINVSTPDEIAFAKLMVALSVSFLICWLPQLLTIPYAQYAPEGDRRMIQLSKLADILMAIHFSLDPYIYVLLRYGLPYLNRLFGLLQRHCYCYCSGSTVAKSEDENTESFIINTSI